MDMRVRPSRAAVLAALENRESAPQVRAERGSTAGAAAFLRGASSRLLPASIPFRYFGAAVVYHVLAWVALLAGADDAARFAGGLGWPLAALHLLTLGVLAMLALGASVQLLPVATLRPVASTRLPALLWWIYTPGVALVALGMGLPAPALLVAGATAVVITLTAFGVLLAINLVGARGMPIVVAHGWVALACLAVTLGSGASLAASYFGVSIFPHVGTRALHVPLAAYGFMGMLALGLSYILVPMFALGPIPAARRGLASCALAAVGLLLGAVDVGWPEHGALAAAALAGLGAIGLYVHSMRTTMRAGMRRRLGRSFTLVKIGWACLVASLVAALLLALDVPLPGGVTLFGVLLLPAGLLSFALGILQRIVPFLAAMHAARGSRRPPTPSALTAETPLALHFHAHAAALAVLAFAVLLDSAVLVRVAALLGICGALAFGAFYATSLVRVARIASPRA